MRRLIFVVCISLLLFACSNKKGNTPVAETIKTEGLSITEIDSPKEAELDGVQPISYKLDTDESIRVYIFSSKENQEFGNKHFQEHQQILSSHAPIVYQKNKYLILYYSNANSLTQTPKLTETKYGEKIQNAINRLK